MTTFEIVSIVMYAFVFGPSLSVLISMGVENAAAMGLIPKWLARPLWGVAIAVGGPVVWLLAVVLALLSRLRKRN